MPIERNENSFDFIFPEFETHLNKAIEGVGPLNKFHNFEDDGKEKKPEQEIPSRNIANKLNEPSTSLYFPQNTEKVAYLTGKK